jgi:DNA-binding transcriptional LysR family regulator
LSRHIAQLEERLDARLIQRTSRQFVVTEVGESFYRRARAVMDEVEAAEAEVRRQTKRLTGQVRLSCSVGVAQFVLHDIVTRFLIEHPGVDVVNNVTNRQVDLIESGLDMVIRGHSGTLPDSDLVKRSLAPTPWFLFAGPRYFERAETPETPEELEGHSGLKAGWKPESGMWSLIGPDDVRASIPFKPRLCCDDMLTLKQAAVAGLGIVALPGYVCRPDVESGRLVRLLPDWVAMDASLSLLMPSRRGVLPPVKALADFLLAEVPGAVAV